MHYKRRHKFSLPANSHIFCGFNNRSSLAFSSNPTRYRIILRRKCVFSIQWETYTCQNSNHAGTCSWVDEKYWQLPDVGPNRTYAKSDLQLIDGLNECLSTFLSKKPKALFNKVNLLARHRPTLLDAKCWARLQHCVRWCWIVLDDVGRCWPRFKLV